MPHCDFNEELEIGDCCWVVDDGTVDDDGLRFTPWTIWLIRFIWLDVELTFVGRVGIGREDAMSNGANVKPDGENDDGGFAGTSWTCDGAGLNSE